jgi:hypothetical protein
MSGIVVAVVVKLITERHLHLIAQERHEIQAPNHTHCFFCSRFVGSKLEYFKLRHRPII